MKNISLKQARHNERLRINKPNGLQHGYKSIKGYACKGCGGLIALSAREAQYFIGTNNDMPKYCVECRSTGYRKEV
jgi:hypothetical protein